MVRFFILPALLLLIFLSPVSSQVPQVSLRSESSIRKHADIYFEREAYAHAARLYQRLAVSQPEDQKLPLLLGDCYRNLREPVKAAYWYGQSLKRDRSSTEHLFHYASVLCASGKYQLAKYWYQAYLSESPSDQRAINALASLVEPQNLFDVRFDIKPLHIDLPGEVFSPSVLGNGLVFVGEGNTGSLVKTITTWQEGPYFDLYFVPIKEDGKAGHPKYLDDQLNSVLHEGPAVFFDEGNQVILTRSNFRRGDEDTRNLQLMIAQRKPSGSWGSPKKLFHHPDYSIGHPAVNQSGTVIYFASNMPGGYGGTDLYRSEYKDGVWQEPVNAGPEINTSGNELFPSMDDQGMLYFSSDGHGGLGGLEILKFKPGRTSKPINMGHPINSPGDDFGITWVPGENSGYFSTDRTGQDRIYQFQQSSQLVNAAVPNN